MKKSILITGASSGLGLACAVLFAQNGYRVFATYRSGKDRNRLSQTPDIHPVKMDVTDADDIRQAFRQVADSVGTDGLFAIINNAGINYMAPFEFADESRAREVIEVNTMAPYKITQTFIPLLKKHNAQNTAKARVLNIASWAGYMGQPFIPFYNASKAALIGLSESMYYDLGLLDIHVVLASPGVTKTPMLNKVIFDGMQNLQAMPQEAQRFYKPYLDHVQTMGNDSGNSNFFPTPEKVAAKLFKIVETRKPRFKYNLSPDAIIMGKMAKLLPFSWLATLNKRMFRLNNHKIQSQKQIPQP